MKNLIISIFNFVKENFNVKLYLSVIAIVTVIVFVEYKWFIYDTITTKYAFDNRIYLINFITFAFTYYLVVFAVKIFKKNEATLNKEFWLKSLVGLMILSVYISYYGHLGIKTDLVYPEKYFFTYTLENLSGIVTALLPIYLVYRIFDKNRDNPFYGFNFKNFNFKIALILTFFAILIAFVGSRFQAVSTYYPILNRTGYKFFSNTVGLDPMLSAGIFESAYMFDFVMIELIFRGFMIFGFVKLLGKNAILPIAAVYSVIHFGKPLPETISSFFGAYFLGIIAYSQKNIGIGVVLHCSLALAIEIFTLA